MDRREFLKKAAAGAAAAGIAGLGLPGGISAQDIIGGARDIAVMGPERRQGKFAIRYGPYELHLRHTFTVSGYSALPSSPITSFGRSMRTGPGLPVRAI